MLAAASADTSESFSVLQTVSSLPCKANGRKYVYNRDVLMDIRKRCGNSRPEELNRLSKLGLLRRGCTEATPDSPGATAVRKHHRGEEASPR